MKDLHIGCSCGEVRGTLRAVAPETSNRVVCYCRFCQEYASRLGRPELLDARGGSEVVQVCPANLHFEAGFDRVVCGRLTTQGALRWYADCCRTPIANTLPGNAPFLGLHPVILRDFPESLDPLFGPVRARVNGAFDKSEAVALRATRAALLSMLWHYSRLFLGWWWRGEHKKSPFFDPGTGAPVLEPHALRTTMQLADSTQDAAPPPAP
jgi:hypothetical protein